MNNDVQMCSHSLETTIIGGIESSWAFASQIKSLPSFIGLIHLLSGACLKDSSEFGGTPVYLLRGLEFK